MILAKYATAFTYEIPILKRAVVDFAVGADWTPAAGDVKVSKDGGAAANIGTLPTAIAMGNTAIWQFVLTGTEMTAARIVITVADSATKAVEDQAIIINTFGNASAHVVFDLGTAMSAQAVASVTGAVGSVTGAVGSVTGNVGGNVTGSVGSVAAGGITSGSFAAAAIDAAAIATDAIGSAELAASAVTEIQTGLATSAALATVQADTDDIQTRLPAALVSGRIDASVGAIAANAITATSIAADAITAAKIAADAIGASELAADAVTEIQSGLSTVTTAQVNAEVVDALATDTYAEVVTAPAANAALSAKINWLFKLARNKMTQTATTTTLLADDGTTADTTSTVSDNGTTFTRGEWA